MNFLSFQKINQSWFLSINNQIKRVEYIEDIALPNAATFEIYLEDHTIGNLLRM